MGWACRNCTGVAAGGSLAGRQALVLCHQLCQNISVGGVIAYRVHLERILGQVVELVTVGKSAAMEDLQVPVRVVNSGV